MLNIVLSLNASEPSKYAFEWAMHNIIRPAEHKVTLLTVVEPPIQAGYYYAASAAMYSPTFIDEVYAKATDEAANTVRDYKNKLEMFFENKVQVEMVVGRGEIRDEVIDYVANAKADLLVIGTRELGALKRTFVGSTSDYCIHHCHCPVLVVKRPAPLPTD